VALVGGASCVLTLSRTVAVDAPLGSATGALDVTATPGGTQHAAPELTIFAGGVLVVDNSDWGLTPTLHPTTKVLTVTNPGPLDATPVTVAITSKEMYTPFYIAMDACKGKALAAGQSCKVTVAADLYDVNQHTAALTATAPTVKPGSGTLTALGVRAHWTLTINFAGTGTGHVDAGGNTIPSPAATQFAMANGMTSPMATAAADASSTFAGWSGTTPCSGTGACAPFVGADNSDLTLTATFTK
jgi:hypothetical protein